MTPANKPFRWRQLSSVGALAPAFALAHPFALTLVLALALVLAFALVLSGCTSGTPAPTSSPSPSGFPAESPSPDASASADPAPAPSLQPGGSASDNLPYFDSVNKALLAGNPMPGGRPIVDNLVAAGFDKSMIQVTPDTTAIGRDVDSMQFSVRFGDECLVGQASPTGYASTDGPTVAGTGCLIGITRTIDW